MKSCKWWKCLDDNNGYEFEWCGGKKVKATCTGNENQCNFPKYFNQPVKVCKALRAKDNINDTIADVERFR